MPINPDEITVDRSAVNPSSGLNPENIRKDSDTPWRHVSGMVDTLRNIGKVYPAFETAASMATATYGVPISGLIGLAALPAGLDAANSAVEAVQKFLVYQPQTKGGQQLTAAANYPMERLEALGGAAGGALERAGYPNAGAAADTLITASPALMQLRGSVGRGASPRQFSQAVEAGINKGVRPSVSQKELWGQRERYMDNAKIAVDEIVNNKNRLKLTDRDGTPKVGELPKTLEEFSQAIEQTKRAVYAEYDGLAKSADSKGASVNITAEIDGLLNNKVLQTMSPETIQYAAARKAALEGKSFSTQEVQQMVQILNQSEKAFYSNPTPELKGKAHVDALIANNLRAGLDAAIEGATGIEYQPLKHKYGALRMLETDVTKRAIVDGRKNIKGLIDFSDIFSASQLMQGIMAQQPGAMAAGAAAKWTATWIKKLNDPNTAIRNMFLKAEIYGRSKPRTPLTLTPGLIGGAVAGETDQ
jgi:hypothetical protein